MSLTVPKPQARIWEVHKFGGTSVGTAGSMRRCIDIIKLKCNKHRIAMVVSAMGGKPKVTDLLLDSVHAAASGNIEKSKEKLETIRRKHKACIDDLFSESIDASADDEEPDPSSLPKCIEQLMLTISKDLNDIVDLLRAVCIMQSAHEQILELVSGYGEIWSARLLSIALKQRGLPFVFLNARDVLVVSEEDSVGTTVHWEISEEKLHKKLTEIEESWEGPETVNGIKCPHLIITGYIASTLQGTATTLKRDGSDFSASIFGKMLRADNITIWTDVSGVYSADPRRVPEAIIIPEVSYTEAIELAYFGAKVIHPKTMAPAIMESIPIYIRNTFEPLKAGTRIFEAPQKGQVTREKCVCGFSTVDDITLYNLEGSGMIGVPGIAQRLFGALKAVNISVLFIAQSSSEHSICFATKSDHRDVVRQSVQEVFFYELKTNMISSIQIIDDCSMIAAVGESMSNSPGVSGLFFNALGKARINILSIAQGCDERNITAVVHGYDSARALKAVHAAFWLSSQVITIGVIGSGRVGSCLIQTLLDTRSMLLERFSIDLQVRGVANSTNMLLSDSLNATLRDSISTINENKRRESVKFSELVAPGVKDDSGLGDKRSNSLDEFDTLSTTSSLRRSDSKLNLDRIDTDETSVTKPVEANLDLFFEFMKMSPSPHIVMIDCSNSEDVAKKHPQWVHGGAHVITSSKRALSSSIELYNELFNACAANNRSYLSEVTIGASVPVLSTLTDMLYSGDAIHEITGLMSVSVGMVLSRMCDDHMSFSQALSATYAQELFEDDVFADLEGYEVAYKLLILARAMGYPLTMEDISIDKMATRREVADWENCGAEFAEEDMYWTKKIQTASAKGCTIRYVQHIECSPPAEFLPAREFSLRASIRLEEVSLVYYPCNILKTLPSCFTSVNTNFSV